VRVAERRHDVLLSGDERQRRSLPLDPLGSAIAATLAVQLLVSGAVITDRWDRSGGTGDRSGSATSSLSPSPVELPRITAEEEVLRQRTARNVARFAAQLVCSDPKGFSYTVAEHNRDVSIATVAGGIPGSPPDLVVKVTRLPGGISYSVEDSSERCDG